MHCIRFKFINRIVIVYNFRLFFFLNTMKKQHKLASRNFDVNPITSHILINRPLIWWFNKMSIIYTCAQFSRHTFKYISLDDRLQNYPARATQFAPIRVNVASWLIKNNFIKYILVAEHIETMLKEDMVFRK